MLGMGRLIATTTEKGAETTPTVPQSGTIPFGGCYEHAE